MHFTERLFFSAMEIMLSVLQSSESIMYTSFESVKKPGSSENNFSKYSKFSPQNHAFSEIQDGFFG